MPRHRFTPAQANRTLPLVRPIVAEILDKGRELREIARRPDAPGARERTGHIEGEIHELLGELAGIGCSYKDWGFEIGLVDFPGEIAGEPVLLCWRSDEAHVAWYHTPEAGYSGRTPIPEPMPDRS